MNELRRALDLLESRGLTLSRRDLLRLSAATGLGAGAAAAWVASAAGRPAIQSADETPKPGGRLTLSTAQDIPQLDPHTITLANQYNLFSGLWNALTKYNVQMEAVPDLAVSWENPEPTVYVFQLRQGVRFHNGREFVADDVKFSLDRVMNPETASTFRNTSIPDLQTVEVLDPYTVKTTLAQPSATFLSGLANVKIVAQENVAELASQPVGTGPWQFAEFLPNDHVRLSKFADYWDKGKPYPDEVVIQIVKDATALQTAFMAGSYDLLWQLPPRNADQVRGNDGFYILAPELSSATNMVMVDCSSPPFNDKRARQALSYATDRETIVEVAYYGLGVLSPANVPIPANHWAFNASLPQYTYDLEKAKALFAEVGVTEGTELTYVTLSTINPEWTVEGEILERSLNEIGITLEIQAVELAAWVDVFLPIGKQWPNIISPNGLVVGWDPAYPTNWYKTGANAINYSNAELDALIDQGRATLDQAARKPIYDRIQEILNDEVPFIIPHQWKFSHAAQAHVKGVWVESGGVVHYEDVWLDK